MKFEVKDIPRERLEELLRIFVARIVENGQSEATDFFLNTAYMTENELEAFELIRHEKEDAWYEFKEEWGHGYSINRFGELVNLFLNVKIPYYSLFAKSEEIKKALNEKGVWSCGKYSISKHTGIRPKDNFYQEEYSYE